MTWLNENVEPEVRKVVKHLRMNGINTTQSCGHRMWVDGDYGPPYQQPDVLEDTVVTVMATLGIKTWCLRMVRYGQERTWHLQILTPKMRKQGRYLDVEGGLH